MRAARRAAAALALVLAPSLDAALAQSPRFDAISPVTGQPDNPGAGQDTGANGLPVLRRRLPDSLSRTDGRAPTGGGDTSGESGAGRSIAEPPLTGPAVTQAPGLSQLDTRVTTGGRRTGGSTTSPSNLAPSALLRSRAAPPRRSGSATRRATQQTVTTPSADLRLTPVIQQAVVGVPSADAPRPAATRLTTLPLLALPIASPALGLLTPGFILGSDLARSTIPDPAYAPLGFRAGNFTLLPSLAQAIGYDTNPDQTVRQAARGSVALRTEAGLDFYNDASTASVAGSLRGAYLETPQNEAASRPAADGVVRARVEAARDLILDADGRFIYDTQRTTSANLQAATATSRPALAIYGGSVGATQTFNRLALTLRGSVDRSQFENVRLNDGTTIDQSDRNLNQYALELRTTYELTPDISPFVSVIGDTRIYDRRIDAGGVRRDSDGLSLLVGTSFGLTRAVTGTISGGLQHRSYNDPTLRDITAPLINASLIWTASPLTTVRFTASTGVSETTLPNSSGVLTDVATIEMQHNLLRNLAVVVGGSFLRNEYQGSTIRETGFSATARLDYRFTRWLTLRGTYIYQQIESNAPASSYKDNTFLVGLRVNP